MKYFYFALSLLLLITFFPLTLILLLREGGRFIVARLCGVPVSRFVIGCGRRLFSWPCSGTQASVHLVPLGAYIEMESEADDLSREQGFWKKSLIAVAGPATLFLLAMVISTFYVISTGSFQPSDRPVIGSVVPGYPAFQAGVQAGDEVVEINEQEIRSWQEIVDSVSASNGEQLSFVVRRSSGLNTLSIYPDRHPEEDGYIIGVTPDKEARELSSMETLQGSFRLMSGVGASFFSGFQSPERPQIFLVTDADKPRSVSYTPYLLLISLYWTILVLVIALLPLPYIADLGHVIVYTFKALSRAPISRNYILWSNRLGVAVMPSLILLFILFHFLF